jgi:hypothetical protein
MDLLITILFSVFAAVLCGSAMVAWWRPGLLWRGLHRLYQARR